jgi:hypothetical protein
MYKANLVRKNGGTQNAIAASGGGVAGERGTRLGESITGEERVVAVKEEVEEEAEEVEGILDVRDTGEDTDEKGTRGKSVGADEETALAEAAARGGDGGACRANIVCKVSYGPEELSSWMSRHIRTNKTTKKEAWSLVLDVVTWQTVLWSS